MANIIKSNSDDETPKSPQNVTALVSPDSDDVQAQEAYRAEFLGSFTADEEKKIMRKVDLHIVILVGLIYSIKQVSCGLHACASFTRTPN